MFWFVCLSQLSFYPLPTITPQNWQYTVLQTTNETVAQSWRIFKK